MHRSDRGLDALIADYVRKGGKLPDNRLTPR